MTVASVEVSPQPVPLACGHCGVTHAPVAQAICPECLGPLEPVYDPTRRLPSREEIASRPPSLWRYREWLPFQGTPVHSLDTGFTPLVEAPRLADLLGVGRLWIKNDTVTHPTLSFKDRVVASAINAAVGLGIRTIACASTGNLAIAVGAHAARAGLEAWVLVPETLEPAKILATAVSGARVLRIRGTYDDVNRLCAQLAERYAWGIVNVNLRPYYGEGSKTVAFEIAEQLGWRLPTAVVAPMAGGSLLSKLYKGFGEIREAGLAGGPAPRLYGAQAAGCAPIAHAVETGASRITPVVPKTIARSLAIGAPADGPRAIHAIRSTGGWAASVSDPELIEAIRILAEHSGIFAETAGGVTTAVALKLAQAGRFGPDDEVVLCITAHGLKTPDAVSPDQFDIPTVSSRLGDVAKVIEA
ncbi:MAG: threonine synthase [Gemmatimonadales bacterium]|nr:threonine synthase [Gemmatimonadota bacterium]MCC7132271.1 threonine synthase [Gemmatimonadales bacterium]MDX2060996.1 threonine synthase [Gemmatimonadales bacterium]